MRLLTKNSGLKMEKWCLESSHETCNSSSVRDSRSLFFFTLIVGLAFSIFCAAEPKEEQADVYARLDCYLPNEESQRNIGVLINELDSDSYDSRNKALKKLKEIPAFPSYVRHLANKEKRPEVKARLNDLIKQSSLEQEINGLNAILKLISENNIKGALPRLASIIQLGTWNANGEQLNLAAFHTVTPDDLPLIEKEIHNESEAVRQLMAAALGGLPPSISSAHLLQLLSDRSDRVALIAAFSLARQKDKACLPVLARLLDSPDFYTRYQSHSALESLSGKSFNYAPSDLSAERETASSHWRRWAADPKTEITGKLPDEWLLTLFNGKDLAEWDVYENGKLAPKQTSWEVKNGQLHCLGINHGDIRTKQRFANYILTLDYKVKQNGGDGGIGVMLTQENEKPAAGLGGEAGTYLEVQLLPGNGGDLYSIGGFKAKVGGNDINFSSPRLAKLADASGKWHQLKLTADKGELKVEINGTIVNRSTDGPKEPGKILIRNEGAKIAFKNVLLLPLQP